jgi:ubiquinol-cytochrome c reductase cytochrome c subunit
MTGRRARPLLVALAAASLELALGLTAPAAAQPPQGIVRPTDERGLSPLELGAQLFAGNCASCHGTDGQGVARPAPQRGAGQIRGQGPPLRAVGAQAADFYLRTGYMPLGDPHEQPKRSRVLFTATERRALTAFVASLAPGPPIPRPDPAAGNLAEGQQLFTQHCAGCHQVVTQGGVVTGARVPPLNEATPVEIAEAVRIGPYVMPSFSRADISDAEMNSLIRYVESVGKRPPDPGGWGIGHVGPIPEGMVTWMIAAVVLVGMCIVLGTRMRS